MALIESKTLNYSFDLHGPVDAICDTTVYEFIQTEKDIQIADYTYGGARGLWAPGGWARSRISGVDASGKPFSVAKAYRGYRAPENLVTFTQNANGTRTINSGWNAQLNKLTALNGDVISNLYIDGYLMSQDVVPTIEINGGPENPVGRTYVTNVSVDPYFTDADGVQYYKKHITTVIVDAERIDDAVSGDLTNNKLASYVTVDEGDGTYSITLDKTLLSSEDDFYNGARIQVYARDKDAINSFKDYQELWVYDYNSSLNKLLLSGDINTGEVVGIYDGSGSINDNSSYDYARMAIVKYAIVGTVRVVRTNYNETTVFYDAQTLQEEDGYAGWSILMTSGVEDGSSFEIASSASNYFQMVISSGGILNVTTDDTFEIIPPYSF